MKSSKRRLTAILCLTALMLISTSCRDTGAPSDTTTGDSESVSDTTIETTEERISTGLEPRDFDGYVFRFSNASNEAQPYNNMQLTVEEADGDTLNDAIYKRNRAVEERLNITITEYESSVGCAEDDLKKSILAGADEFDAAYIRGWNIKRFYSGGDETMYYDFASEVPNVDLDKPWWTKSANESMSIAGKMPFVVGDISLSYFDSVMPIAMNLRFVDDYSLGNPYELVRDGRWTMDVVGDMMKKVSSDLNGDGESTLDDQFGMFGMSEEYVALTIAAGSRIIEKDENDIPYLAIDDERFQSAFEKAVAILNQKDVFANYRLKKYNIDVAQLGTFTDGRALFFSDVLFWISGLRDMRDNFAILPRAKYDETQEKYYTNVHECGAWLCIPLTADPERSGYILEELSAESHYTLIPAYYDTVLSQKFARDEDSVEMLDIIFETRVSDLGCLYNFGDVYNRIKTMGEKGDTGLQSFAEKIRPKVESAIAKLIG